MKGFRVLALAVILCLLSSPAFATRYELDDGRFFILSTGGSFAYARDTAGRIQVWGDNQYGQLGKGHFKNTGSMLGVFPSDFKTKNQHIDLTQLHDIVSGSNYSFFWMEDGTLYAVGNSDYGSLGKAEGYYSTHTLFTVPEKIVDLSCGFGHCLALTDRGEVYAWGRNNKGQVGDGSRKKAVAPVKLPLRNIVQIVAGGQFSLALDADGTLWGWGDNQYKTVSPGKEEYFASPVRIDTASIAISAIEAGGYHAVLLDRQGQVWTWGKNDVYQLGIETKGKTLSQPTLVSLPLPAVKLSVYSAQNFAILSDSSLWSWGNNGYGQLGQGLRGVSGAMPGKCVDSGVIVAETGSMFALCVLEDGAMLCAGFNNHAELGDGTTYHHNVMTPNGMDLTPD
jgi:alpha-tubulin suppressor-like RCC1 family protein